MTAHFMYVFPPLYGMWHKCVRVCGHTCIWVTCVFMFLWRSEVDNKSLLSCSSFYLLRLGFSLALELASSSQSHLPDWPRNPLSLFPQCQDYGRLPCLSRFYVDSGGPSSSPPTCMVSALSADPSPQPHFMYLYASIRRALKVFRLKLVTLNWHT